MSSSSWKDSSDFASLAAALSKAKTKTIPKTPLVKEENVNNHLTKAGDKDIKIDIDESLVSSSSSNSLLLTDQLDRLSSSPQSYTDFPVSSLSEEFPPSSSFIFKQHKSTVSALEFESSGARFLSGSHDTTVAYWDFNGMVKDQPVPFRFIEPMGSHTVNINLYY